MSNSHWLARSTHWSKIKAPLRPTNETVTTQKTLLDYGGSILLLGGTPEYWHLFDNICALDREPSILKNVWPGDRDNKSSRQADWMTVDIPSNTYDGIVGDGSLNMVKFPTDAKILINRCIDWLKPGKAMAIRLFSRPNKAISINDLRQNAQILSWDAWRANLNMYIACNNESNVLSAARLEIFNMIFPDREELADETGWDLEMINTTMDSYKNGTMTTSYPTIEEWKSIIPDTILKVDFVDVGGYELSDFFPILYLRKPT